MTLYQRYSRLPIPFSALGLERGSEKSSYFCTPRGARVIGWAGVDGIHFCFVPGYGEAVFAVNPMAAEDHVQIVARSFADFLSLVLACGGSAAIEQARDWTREKFDAFVEKDPAYRPRQDALDAIAGLGVTAMADPYGYLEALRGQTDVSTLQVKEASALPEAGKPFPVDWGGSIHGSLRRHRPARETAVNAVFSWGEEEWHVPKLYICAEGIVVDYCVGVEAERVKTFWRHYEELCGGDYGVELSEEQREALGQNPLDVAFHSVLAVDGMELPAKSGSGTFWVPEGCGSEELAEESRRTRAIVEHYGLDESKAWTFWRGSYPWKKRRGNAMKQVSLRLIRDRVSLTAARFTDPTVGEEIGFVHPATGETYSLRIAEVERQTIDQARFRDPDTVYPEHFVALTAAVEPILEGVTIRDCDPGDQPRSKNSGAMGVILFGRRSAGLTETAERQTIHAASSLYFSPPRSVTWRAVVQIKPMEDKDVCLQ